MGIALDGAQAARLLRLLDELAHWNRSYNLTAITTREGMISAHLLDSLAAQPDLQGQRIADVGTGAGFPGLPLALIEPQRQFTLIDSVAKKIRFVTHAVRVLELANVVPRCRICWGAFEGSAAPIRGWSRSRGAIRRTSCQSCRAAGASRRCARSRSRDSMPNVTVSALCRSRRDLDRLVAKQRGRQIESTGQRHQQRCGVGNRLDQQRHQPHRQIRAGHVIFDGAHAERR